MKRSITNFELYPWHSAAVTARIRPDIDLIDRFVWQPVRELQAPVFAFDAAWHTYLEEIPSLRVVTHLEPNDELSHKVTALTDDRGLLIVAISHRGGAMPPRTASVARLREVIAGRWN